MANINISKMQEIQQVCTELNLVSVYDVGCYSFQELYYKLANRLNEVIIELKRFEGYIDASVTEQMDIIENLLKKGMADEVVLKLNEWLADGTLAEVINLGVFTEINEEIEKINNKRNVTVEDFGAVGDGVTDDTQALQNAFDWSKENKKPIFLLDKRYYVSQPLKVGNAIIRGQSGVAGNCNILYLQRQDKSYLINDAPNWNYLFNKDTSISWRTVIDELAYGCCIVSDKNISILTASNNETLNIEGVCVVGNHREVNQVGITDSTPTKYKGNQHFLKNIRVVGCGNDGIRLLRGLECSILENVTSECNNGNGLFVGYNQGIDSATEYLQFRDCRFAHNRLDGVHFKYWRKEISFENCYFNGNGQYYINEVDPLLQYDRRIPTVDKYVKAGIFFENGNLEGEDSTVNNKNFTMKNCYGEDSAKGVHFSCKQDGKFTLLIGLDIQNNVFYRGSVPKNDCCTFVYIDVDYIEKCRIRSNNAHGMDEAIKFRTTPADGGYNEIYDGTFPLTFMNEVKVSKNIETEKRVYSNNTLFYGKKPVSGVIQSSEIQNHFNRTSLSGQGNKVAVYTLTGHWQSDNNTKFGGYLLVVTELPVDRYVMLTLPLGSTEGFASAPTISTTGVLNIDCQEYYVYTLTRIDLNKTI